MRRFTLILTAFLLLGVLDLQAQQAPENFLGMTVKEDAWQKDSVKIADNFSRSGMAQMPVYNPKDVDSKILIHRPEGIIYNMPVIGKKDSLSGSNSLLDPGKNLFKKGPSDNGEEQEDDSTEQE